MMSLEQNQIFIDSLMFWFVFLFLQENNSVSDAVVVILTAQ